MFAAKESSSKVAKTDIDRHPSLPSVSLPKGGGAIRGIGEKFTSNPVTGTGSLSVPIYTSPGRSGFGPQLSLSYDSGAGNGPFGFGWNLSLPSIMRKTDKGLPIYQDDDESDTFILSGVEDLVPVLVQVDGQWQRDMNMRTLNGVDYCIQRYRPRVEGLFARIERWTNLRTGEIHWRSISRDNISTMYGKTAESRIADPDDPQRVFSWLICESYDDKGNAILYEYKAENSQGIDLFLVHERNRTDATRAANHYLKRIKYGNKAPYKLGEDLTARNDWMFEVVFDYGEHYSEDNQGQPTTVFLKSDQRHWKVRLDPFSSYRAGFEIRTYRLCRRVLMFHHFPDELGADDYLVRSTDFTYAESSIASFITSITQSGYVRRKDEKYLKKSLPPLEFGYSQATIRDEIQEIDADSLKDLPSGLDGTRYQWVDLDGEGVSGILTEQEGALFYKRNLSSLPVLAADGKPTLLARFAPVEKVATIPSLTNLRGGRQQLMDLAGDGQLDLVHFDAPLSGYFERTLDEKWESFIQFASVPNVPWHDPNLRFVDLTGDGHADILITEDEAFTWYPSLAERGFAEGKKVRQALDDEKGPRLFFADATESIYLADMSGDGMVDLVRIRNGEVCYWPNLGYGRFGAKVTMDNAPWFDTPDQFDQRRIRLADIDGSSVTDIIYIGRDGVRLYFNQSGNSWSDARTLTQFPQTDNLSLVTVVDLLGNGTACLVWWSPLPRDAPKPIRYIDLMGGQKPHLLVSVKNNMGAETRVQYASSTKFYLMDKAAGKPWITRLPFPVQVVERVETRDYLTNTKLVSLSKYHHGYYDGDDREFRGFGLVERWDTESFYQFQESELFAEEHETIEEGLHVPPVYMKTWFHTGAHEEGETISRHYVDEYYDGDLQAILLPDTLLPSGLNFKEEDEACRALKGQILREEIYALDDSNKSRHPYSVSERNYQLKLLQPLQDNRHAVFYPHEREIVDFHYERNPKDPRILHRFTLKVDDYGNVEKQATVYYPRRKHDGLVVYPEQLALKTIVNLTDYSKIIDKPDVWITGQIYQSRSYELGGLKLNGSTYFEFDEIDSIVTRALQNVVDFGENFANGSFQARIFHWERQYYWDGLRGTALPLGKISSPTLLHHNETAVFPDSYANKIYGNQVTDNIMEKEGGYRKDSGYWWNTEIRQYYLNTAQFYLPYVTVDQFGSFDPTTLTGTYSKLEYDKYNLIPVKFTDALKNVIQADIDYRVIQPKQLIDINGNHSQVLCDEFGIVIAFSIFGKVNGIAKGDGDLSDFKIFPDANRNDVLANPQKYVQNATAFFYYDYFAWMQHRLPPHSIILQREVHQSELQPSEETGYQFVILYSDGIGRELQKKVKVESGSAWIRQPDGSYKEQDSTERWLTSGRIVYNNKGKPVKQYEPFYSASSDYESEKSLVEFGVTPILHYDPLERVIRTDTPKGFFSSVIFDAWTHQNWDENDNVKESRFYDELINQGKYPSSWTPERVKAEKDALIKTESHANTPKVTQLNNIAHPFMEMNSVDSKQIFTYYELDIKGNKLSIIDPRQYAKNHSRGDAEKIKSFQFSYDMQNRELLSESMDTGVKKTLQNALNNPVYEWSARGFCINTKYDALQRPVEVNVKGNGLDNIVEKIEYGESSVNPEENNLRGKPIKHYDQAGVKEFLCYDIEDHNIKFKTRVRDKYKEEVNWIVDPEPQDEYLTKVDFDALGRLVSRKQSDGSTYRYKYHQSGLLKSVAIELVHGNGFEYYVADVQYNAKGQRERIEYGNGTVTRYGYERETWRLESLKTVRSSDNKTLQDISYVYDPVGNICRIEDRSHKTVFHNQSVVDPVFTYTYDSLYRLRQATGRQHPSIMSDDHKSPNAFKQSRYLSFDSVSINDSTALENYSETYLYDFSGNLEEIRHFVQGNTSRWWTRTQMYADDSNRIVSSHVGNDTAFFTYDAAGNMTQLEHLKEINWNYRNNISSVVLIKRDGKDDAEYYVYDSAGMRVRKVLERYVKINGVFKFLQIEEKLYLDGYETKRIKRIDLQNNASMVLLERHTDHVMDDKKRIAIIHKWTTDVNGRETDDLTTIKVHYQLGNHLRSCSLEINEEAEIISYEEYYPHGGTAFIAGKSVRSVPTKEVSTKEYRYSGKERDDSTGLYYFGVRYFAPWLGRWASPDPIGIQEGINTFEFVHNNPINIIEIDGMGGGWWSETIEGVRDAQRWVKETSFKAGSKIMDSAETFIEKTGIENKYLKGAIRGGAVLQATLTSTVLEVGAGIIMAGPNALEALDTAGTDIGEGMAMVTTAKNAEETALGIARISGGVGQGALVTVEALSMASGTTGGKLKYEKGMTESAKKAKLREHSTKFEKKVSQREHTVLNDAADQVTISPNKAPGVPADFSVRVDTLSRSKITGSIKLTEVKSTANAPLTPNQKAGYPLIEQFGGTIQGLKGGINFPPGTQIPAGIKVDILRPNDWANIMLLPLFFGVLGNTAHLTKEQTRR